VAKASNPLPLQAFIARLGLIFEMTTFTRIGERDTPSILTSADQTISDIDLLLYGGFAE
jgi:hypothetical protein